MIYVILKLKVFSGLEYTKGGEFYDRLGADVGARNPKRSALVTFIDGSG